jgi:hypothetical protein
MQLSNYFSIDYDAASKLSVLLLDTTTTNKSKKGKSQRARIAAKCQTTRPSDLITELTLRVSVLGLSRHKAWKVFLIGVKCRDERHFTTMSRGMAMVLRAVCGTVRDELPTRHSSSLKTI